MNSVHVNISKIVQIEGRHIILLVKRNIVLFANSRSKNVNSCMLDIHLITSKNFQIRIKFVYYEYYNRILREYAKIISLMKMHIVQNFIIKCRGRIKTTFKDERTSLNYLVLAASFCANLKPIEFRRRNLGGLGTRSFLRYRGHIYSFLN